MKPLTFPTIFQSFESHFVSKTTGQSLKGVIVPEIDKYIGLQPGGEIQAPKIKIHMKSSYKLNVDEVIIWKNDEYVIINKMAYDPIADLIIYVAQLIWYGD